MAVSYVALDKLERAVVNRLFESIHGALLTFSHTRRHSVEGGAVFGKSHLWPLKKGLSKSEAVLGDGFALKAVFFVTAEY